MLVKTKQTIKELTIQHWAHKTQNEDKQNTQKQYNTEHQKDEKHGPPQKPWVNPSSRNG
jgi:hypothetical protein